MSEHESKNETTAHLVRATGSLEIELLKVKLEQLDIKQTLREQQSATQSDVLCHPSREKTFTAFSASRSRVEPSAAFLLLPSATLWGPQQKRDARRGQSPYDSLLSWGNSAYAPETDGPALVHPTHLPEVAVEDAELVRSYQNPTFSSTTVDLAGVTNTLQRKQGVQVSDTGVLQICIHALVEACVMQQPLALSIGASLVSVVTAERGGKSAFDFTRGDWRCSAQQCPDESSNQRLVEQGNSLQPDVQPSV